MSHLTLKDRPRALDTLHDVGCMHEGERISEEGAAAAVVIYYEYRQLQKRVKELEQRIIDMQSCVACGGLLLPSDSPPHCEDCHPDEEQEITWQRKVRKWDEELENNNVRAGKKRTRR
jgi:hypothetical protein